jgi:hypothetical protein
MQRNSKISSEGLTRHAGQFGIELDHVFWCHVRPVGLPLGILRYWSNCIDLIYFQGYVN